jgi:hypothetical protein
MPHGKFVAWDLANDEPHICPEKSTTVATKGSIVRRTPIKPTPWAAITESTPRADAVTRSPPSTPQRDYTASRLADRMPDDPSPVPTSTPSATKVSGKAYYRSRRDAALAGLPIHRFTGTEWSTKLRTSLAARAAPATVPQLDPAPASPWIQPRLALAPA